MKMLIAIVNNDDAHIVNSSLSKEGFSVTKIASTGGFLMSGNSTFLLGVEDVEVDHAIETIGRYSKKRVQPTPVDLRYNMAPVSSYPVEVTVGGASIFVIDVEKHIKV